MSALPDLNLALEVEPVAGGRFVARTEAGRPGRIFGGQVMAQSLVAASRTVPSERVPYHLHAQFVQGGLPDDQVEFDVETSADLGRFTHRRVRSTQGARHLLDLSASFQVPEEGLVFGQAAPAVDAEDVPLLSELIDRGDCDEAGAEWVRRLTTWIPVEIRGHHLPGRAPLSDTGAPTAQQSLWMKSHHPMPDDPLLHRCGAVYLSDLFLLTTALGCHGLRMTDGNVFAVTLDHSMWFHAPVRLDDWLRYDEEAVWTGGGRVLCRGRMFDRAGRLVASTTQGGLLRVRDDVAVTRSA